MPCGALLAVDDDVERLAQPAALDPRQRARAAGVDDEDARAGRRSGDELAQLGEREARAREVERLGVGVAAVEDEQQRLLVELSEARVQRDERAAEVVAGDVGEELDVLGVEATDGAQGGSDAAAAGVGATAATMARRSPSRSAIASRSLIAPW